MTESLKTRAIRAKSNGATLQTASLAFGMVVGILAVILIIIGLIPVCPPTNMDCYSGQGFYNIGSAGTGIALLLSGIFLGVAGNALGSFIELRAAQVEQEEQS